MNHRLVVPLCLLVASCLVGCSSSGGGNAFPSSPVWGETKSGVQARLSLKRTSFSVNAPIEAVLDIKVDPKTFPDKINLALTAIHYRSVGAGAYAGSMFLGSETLLDAVTNDQGEVTHTCKMDLAKAYSFIPRINTAYEVSVGYTVGYDGSKAIWANSQPVTMEVHVPGSEVLNYYLSELTSARPREIARQMGDHAVPYPVDELVRIGNPALLALEERCRRESRKEIVEKLVFPIRYFSGDGIAVLRRLSQDAKGALEVEVARELNRWGQEKK